MGMCISMRIVVRSVPLVMVLWRDESGADVVDGDSD